MQITTSTYLARFDGTERLAARVADEDTSARRLPTGELLFPTIQEYLREQWRDQRDELAQMRDRTAAHVEQAFLVRMTADTTAGRASAPNDEPKESQDA